jgi:hypothetical protein
MFVLLFANGKVDLPFVLAATLLIYLHDERTPLTSAFFSEILLKEVVVNYLRENYIIWPLDVTSCPNREKQTIVISTGLNCVCNSIDSLEGGARYSLTQTSTS